MPSWRPFNRARGGGLLPWIEVTLPVHISLPHHRPRLQDRLVESRPRDVAHPPGRTRVRGPVAARPPHGARRRPPPRAGRPGAGPLVTAQTGNGSCAETAGVDVTSAPMTTAASA